VTTIAYRDGVLAADQQVTADGAFDGEHAKICRRKAFWRRRLHNLALPSVS
jgi:hypothetical protein